MRLLSRKEVKNLKSEQKRQQIREARSIIELIKKEKLALDEFKQEKEKAMIEMQKDYKNKMAQLENKRAKLSNEVSVLESDKKAALRFIQKAKLILEELKTD